MTAATTLRPGHDQPLTRAEREFLEQLRFRERQPDGAQGAFVFELPRRRQGLIVLTLMNTYATHPKFTKNQRTLDLLESAGLVEIGPHQPLPEPFAPKGDGRPITITRLCRDTLG